MTCKNSSINYWCPLFAQMTSQAPLFIEGTKSKQAATAHGGSTHIGLSDFQNYVACVTI